MLVQMLLLEVDIKLLLTMVQTHLDPSDLIILIQILFNGKIIRGKRSGALMQITEFANATGSTTFFGNLCFLKTLK